MASSVPEWFTCPGRTIATMTTDDQADAQRTITNTTHQARHAHHEHHEHRPEPLDYAEAVEGFRAEKDHYFKHADGSPLPAAEREGFEGFRTSRSIRSLRFDDLTLEPYAGSEPQRFAIPTSDGKLRPAHRAGSLPFRAGWGPPLAGRLRHRPSSRARARRRRRRGRGALPSVFVPFLDATSGHETYGAGRYLDLEPEDDGTYSLDFNLAYHPSCVYDIRFSCPLTPAENRLPIRIEAGERLSEGDAGH